jgi:hypothetical protein
MPGDGDRSVRFWQVRNLGRESEMEITIFDSAGLGMQE